MRPYSRNDYLFSEYDMFSVMENQKRQLQTEVAAIAEQRLLNTSTEDLIKYLTEKYRLDVPKLNVDHAVADQKEAMVQVSGFMYGFEEGQSASVPGTEVTLEVPFDGDAQMFKVRPSTFSSAPPIAFIKDGNLVLVQRGQSLATTQVQANFDKLIAEINQYLDWQRRDADTLNNALPNLARQNIEQRKSKLLANQSLVSGLKFKLKERSDAPKTYAAPITRKKIEPRMPPASTTAYKPEPVLPEEDYQNILKIVQDMALVMERSPAAFSSMGEEDIRQHFLVQLNGHYEGEATGETFNANGKTDILIRHQGKNIFIAECKFWRGEKQLLETIDQILSYLSWRDTKVAIIIFNKNRDFTAVLEKIRDVSSQHPRFKSGPKVEGDTRFRYKFGQKDDPNREIVLTILAFDVPRADIDAGNDGPHVRSL